ncbi:hypothetical protein [Paenibacillus sp.]|jgi:colicin import membrane protein|uniref:hypothetical protein n=1 Tax=Paenibacillus sp. TaxID=58172 RepID=UPI00281718C0|nr:hypothetical protein [Paenibacillus sp.]MDR0271397.1 hypothetical protein [Paenibacillus sp.]
MKRSNHYSGWGLKALVFIMTILLLTSGPIYAAASGWDTALSNIEQLHDRFTALESANTYEKQQIQNLRKQNNDKLAEMNMKVQLIDKDKIDKLKSEAEQAQKRYAPLLAEYAELGKKAAEAKKRKDAKSALLYDLKRNHIKASVLAAKQEINTKKKALSFAKKQSAEKAKIVKDALLPVQTFKKQVTAENLKITEINKSKSEADKSYKSAVKQGEAVTAEKELKKMIDMKTQVQSSQRRILELEGNIAKALRSAEMKLPI